MWKGTLKNVVTPICLTASKVYDSLESLNNQRLGTFAVKDKILKNYNDLKLPRDKIWLEIAKIDKLKNSE